MYANFHNRIPKWSNNGFVRKPVLGIILESVKLQKQFYIRFILLLFKKIMQENVILRVKYM